jgi:murein DD-endopeptidase MepM/ murein hydrolase activator NlpD
VLAARHKLVSVVGKARSDANFRQEGCDDRCGEQIMGRRYYTFLVFPGAHGNLRKIRVPLYVFHVVMGFALAGVMTLGALAKSYARMLLKVADYNTLRTEREALKTQCHNLEGAVSQTHKELMSLQSLATEVALTYSFNQGGRRGLAADVLTVAKRGNASLGGDFSASLSAFNMMKVGSLVASYPSTSSPFIREAAYEDSATPSIWPLRGTITAGFGQRMDPFTGEGAFHTGIDLAAPFGSPVRAAGDGIVLHAGPDSSYGNEALIDHGYGLTTKYCHLRTLNVVVGQEVSRGQIIGSVGMTGRTTGPHLHYEVLVDGTPVNPVNYLHD